MDLSDKEILKFAVENGIIDTNTIRKQIEMNERKKYLNMQKYETWQGKNGLWYTYLPDEIKGRKLVKRKTKEAIDNCIIDYWKTVGRKESDKISKIDLNTIFPEWLSFKAKHTKSTSYIKRITADWDKFYKDDKEFIEKPLSEMMPIYLDEWAHDMIKKYDMTKKMYYNMSIILRQCLDYAVDKKYIAKNPFSDVKINTKMFRRVKKKTGETEVYSIEEEKNLILDMIRRFNNDPTSTAPLAVILLFEIGVRIGELCALKFEDIDGNYIHIQRQEVRDFVSVDDYKMKFNGFKIAEYTKSDDGFRDIYLTKTAKKIIEVVKATNVKNGEPNDSFIFIRDGENINHYSIQAMILRGCEKLEIKLKTSHKIRKTYISTLIDSGLNIDQIRRMAGHSDERTTYGNYCYNRLTDVQTEEIIENALNSEKVIKGNQNLIAFTD